MDCEEAVYSNDYYDFIREYELQMRGKPTGNCIQRINENYDVEYLSRRDHPPLSIQNYDYTSIPKCYTLMDEGALEASGILRIQRQPTLSLKGQGVLVGFLDTGARVIIMSKRKEDSEIKMDFRILFVSLNCKRRFPSKRVRQSMREKLQCIPKRIKPRIFLLN